MGGTIGCESEEGVGSTFHFTIPLGEGSVAEAGVAAEPPAAETGESLSPPGKGEKARLLVAEDDEVTRKVLSYMLEKSGFDFDFAEDGLEAVEMWEKGEYDLIVIDGQMPRMDGFTAVCTIREMETGSGRRVPIIAMTAHALRDDRERFVAAGVDEYVTKPIDFKRCLGVIRGLLKEGSREESSSA
jgi:CheY-like chemotaxis protein